MSPRSPRASLLTHDVTNQPRPFEGVNLFDNDAALFANVDARGATAHERLLSSFARKCGSAEVRLWAEEANRHTPELTSFDRYGHRLDEVTFHPSYHKLMDMGLAAGVAGAAWQTDDAGHVLHTALLYLMSGVDAGVCCPMSMTYAAIPALQNEPVVAAEWAPRAIECRYDPRAIPAKEKQAVTIGMAMTEKQGGSDIRANTTRAEKTGDQWTLTGHKWFCSAPMSDAFLTLAQAEDGLTCFLVPRWRPDGTRNNIHLMRLKDKLGDRSNASAEIDYHGAFAWKIGEQGRGIRTIMDMVQHTRLDCVAGSAGAMRAALAEALWHTAHRSAFQKKLIDQPAMARVLAELVLEAEGATALAFRLAQAFDQATDHETASAYARLATPIAKYFVCKRQPGFVYEALEAHGGNGFVETGPMARLYRAAPLNAIWEGSGNVIALDILRVVAREPECLEAVIAEITAHAGAHGAFDGHVRRLNDWLSPGALDEASARRFADDLGLALAASALRDIAPDDVFEAYCAARLDPKARGQHYGASSAAFDANALIARAAPF